MHPAAAFRAVLSFVIWSVIFRSCIFFYRLSLDPSWKHPVSAVCRLRWAPLYSESIDKDSRHRPTDRPPRTDGCSWCLHRCVAPAWPGFRLVPRLRRTDLDSPTTPTRSYNAQRTRSSADADNLRDAFSGHSRSTNMVPFWIHCDFSLSMWSAPRVTAGVILYFRSRYFWFRPRCTYRVFRMDFRADGDLWTTSSRVRSKHHAGRLLNGLVPILVGRGCNPGSTWKSADWRRLENPLDSCL